MKTILVNPMYYMFNEYPPIGLASIGAVLEKNGFEVSIIDMKPGRVSYKELATRLAACDIVGVTSMSENSGESLKVARIAKKLGKTVIVGGAHVSMMPAVTLADEAVDFGVIGEGEATIVELMEHLSGRKPAASLEIIPGLAFRKDGKVVLTPPRTLIKDLDSLPFPAYHMLPPLHVYFAPQVKNFPLGAIMSSRGCPFGCVYCSKSVFGRTFRQHSPERILSDIKRLVREHGVRELHVLDDAFNADMARAKNIFRSIISENLGCSIYFPAGLRIDNIDEEFIDLLKKAGGYGLNVGVETGNSGVMRSINKALSLETVETKAKLIMDSGLLLSTNFMIGHLSDTEETIRQSVDFAIKLNPNFAGFQITTIYRDTELYKQAAAMGLTSPANNTGFEYCVTPGFTMERLKELRRSAMLRFMLRPAYIPRLLKALRTYKFFYLAKSVFRLFVLRFMSTWESR
jgi:radical SAM superfamily enzyme YgiQ (UPF0313 family)